MLPGSPDTVTTYRNLAAFLDAGLVARTNLGHDHAHYELKAGREPHDHAVCVRCGLIQDVMPKAGPARQRIPGFAKITDCSVEYSGVCFACARR